MLTDTGRKPGWGLLRRCCSSQGRGWVAPLRLLGLRVRARGGTKAESSTRAQDLGSLLAAFFHKSENPLRISCS